jgi:hypothetical protein
MATRVGKFRKLSTLGLTTLDPHEVDHPAPLLF